MFKTMKDFLNWAEKRFIKEKLHFGHGTDNAWDEAVALATFALKLPSNADSSLLNKSLSQQESDNLYRLTSRRITERIPVPYLSHTAWFADLPFYVNENVLIPRSPMAELIENHFQPWVNWEELCQTSQRLRILDLCCGSACIAIACAKYLGSITVDAVDIDEQALSVAKINVIRHGVEDRVQLLQSNLFSACKDLRYDIIISNPPYVSLGEMSSLPREYTHEPKLALAASLDGLNVVRRILDEAYMHLNQNGLLIVEVGNASDELMVQYPDLPFTWLEFERGGEGVFLLEKGEGGSWKAF